MQPERGFWEQWANFLHRKNLDSLSIFLLDAGAPLTIIASQLAYLVQPFFRQSLSSDQWEALMNLFEDHQEGQAFAIFLREGKHCEPGFTDK